MEEVKCYPWRKEVVGAPNVTYIHSSTHAQLRVTPTEWVPFEEHITWFPLTIFDYFPLQTGGEPPRSHVMCSSEPSSRKQ